ncbi:MULTISPECIES: hypothetical protein [unclassified Acinetobacter]|uniref:hypothetical protein n=1 Tax=unclassified Acinetobacter TaxID=196816 RepID=UPI002575A034|nr:MULTISPECIES: hypothetical protein [unclassified Acinetobacter]MDM1764216.1 hypothetical protein [Acinetobacter sp. 226-1]MDM1767886.1 hypothetical protein [Acinetobacter sp. 226-4]
MDKIDQFIQIWLDFSLKLHERQGMDEVLFAEMIQLLKDIDAEYRAKDYIPKN